MDVHVEANIFHHHYRCSLRQGANGRERERRRERGEGKTREEEEEGGLHSPFGTFIHILTLVFVHVPVNGRSSSHTHTQHPLCDSFVLTRDAQSISGLRFHSHHH